MHAQRTEARPATGYVELLPGDPAPHFRQRSIGNPNYAFGTAAGRYLVLLFHGSASDPHSEAAISAVAARPDLFDDRKASFFGVTADPGDISANRIVERIPGIRHFLDFDAAIAKLYGAVARDADPSSNVPVRRLWVVLDPMLRVDSVFPLRPDRSDIAALIAHIETLPPPERFVGFEVPAPVLILPRVFEPELCATLIAHYDRHGGEDSGFMREVDGKTVLVTDPNHKRRQDCTIDDPKLIAATRARVLRRIVPEIARIHQFAVTRMERYLVAQYSEADRGHFAPHRDNTTKGTAHRRFAVSINLNLEFEGGDIFFPEYGPRGYRPPPGGACVFSCSMLHAVRPVTQGKRYAFLPFLYDDAAAKLREANNAYLGDGVGTYRA